MQVGLLYDCPRSATVAATTDAVVWVLERSIFRCGSLMLSLIVTTTHPNIKFGLQIVSMLCKPGNTKAGRTAHPSKREEKEEK
eukprot:1158005-Pelagomonas_calceolata.AAC.2